jgi:protein-S-isoprenylcysteine O-methyltransferase Ste14
MQGYLAIVTLILVIIMVLIRVQQMRIIGIKAMKFGDMDKKDFFILPFVLSFFYLILSSVLILPSLGFELFSNEFISWIGVGLCLLGLILFLSSLISLGKVLELGLMKKNQVL